MPIECGVWRRDFCIKNVTAMKTKLTFLLLLLVTFTFAQTIRRVNNNAGVTGTNIFATIQAAHDAAVSGDIIYVEGSTTPYGDLVCTKPLTFVGPGFFLNQNPGNPNFNNLGAIVGTVLFKPGSQNSTITGLQTSTITILRVSNITINRNLIIQSFGPGQVIIDCFEAPSSYNSVSNINITGNSINNGIELIARQNAGLNYTISNLLVKSNILTSVGFNNTTGVAALVTSAAITNNTFRNYPSGVNFSIWNTTFQNNIIQVAFNSNTPLVLTNSTATNNVALATNLPSGNGNVNNIADPFVGNSTTDSFFRLKPGSAASGAGVGGTDCGAFGGDTPYVLSGIPNYPTFSSFNTSGTGSSATPLTVTISTKSNN